MQLSYTFSGSEITYPDGSRFKSIFHWEDENPKVKFEGTMFYPNNKDVVEGTLIINNFIKFNDHLSDNT